jgi:sugar lactone lactonase YvrE
MYVADLVNNRIRKVTPTGVVTTLAGSGSADFADGTGTSASFNYPSGVVLDDAGNVYVADSNNNRVRKVTSSTGEVTTLAGSGSAAFADGTGTSASFSRPLDVSVDGDGNVYVGDYNNFLVRKVTPTGEVTTLAGSGSATFADGAGSGASFVGPHGVALDNAGNLYVSDYRDHRIRKVTPTGVVTTLAGSGSAAFADGSGTGASFYWPRGVALDGAGNVYVADHNNHRIRKIV